eukprot:704715-Prymnesium_polylepis.1
MPIARRCALRTKPSCSARARKHSSKARAPVRLRGTPRPAVRSRHAPFPSAPPHHAATPRRSASPTAACARAQVTNELVDVLLTPLLREGSADVVFDTLSYSAGPLPEPLLADPRLAVPVQVVFGEEDPWTPPARVRALERFASVRGVVGLPGVGHCPHDEAPGLVNPMIADFVRSLRPREA